VLRYDTNEYILKSLGEPSYVSLLSLLMKCMHLHIESIQSTEITELKTGVERTDFFLNKTSL
jgi:hypothetical protein